LKAAEEMGMRCPEDFGLVSFDDYPWLAVFRPRLTTVELPKYQIGFEATELLLKRIKSEPVRGGTLKLAPELHVRESCGFQLRPNKNSPDSRNELRT
jgi:DNA-binding LacI/PurR family transcriptional regulator